MVACGDFPNFGQSRFSHVDIFTHEPLEYFDTHVQLPLEVFRRASPTIAVYLFGDGFLHPLGPNSLAIADHPNFDWDVIVGRSSLFAFPNFSPFEDTPPVVSHKTYVKAFVSVLHASQKKSVSSNLYIAYCGRSSAADPHTLGTLDNRN